jgi:hypothetical protein
MTQMDRERLKDVQTSDLKDDRLNEDFVLWLKTKGPSWLLVILVAIVAYLFIVNWQQQEARHRNEAWIALLEAQLPTSLEDVAAQYPDVDSVAHQARLRAANMYLRSVHLNRAVGSTLETPVELAAEDRDFNLERADALYGQVRADAGDSEENLLMLVTALNGQAAVAESRGDTDAARMLYEQSAAAAGTSFPFLAARANNRAATVDRYQQEVVIPEAPVVDTTAVPFLPETDSPTSEELSNPLNIPTLPTAPDAPTPGSDGP